MNTAIEFKHMDMEQERQIFKRVQSAIGHIFSLRFCLRKQGSK